MAKSANGVTTRYLVDDLNPTGYPQVVDELANGVVTRTYTYGLQRTDEEQVVSNTGQTSYYGYDGMGTVRQLTDPSGAITDTYDYDAFGNLVSSTGTTPNNYLYRGEQWDPDLGLYYLRARYYNPVTGRFMSRDPEDHAPANPNDLHKYLYADGNPVNALDPSGKGIIEYAWNSFKSTVRTAIEGTRIGESALCFLKVTTDALNVAAVGFYHANPINANLAALYGELRDCLELASLL